MRWKGRQKSKNVEDRRMGGGAKVGAGLGLGSILVLVIAVLMGGNPLQLLEQMGGSGSSGTSNQTEQTTEESNARAEFVSVVLNDTETVWNKLFPEQLNRNYKPPTLVMFSGTTRSACGNASAASGPFYCPGDQKVYIDLGFYDQLSKNFGAGGDFAMAYVIAHEVGHHVQDLLGITDEVHKQRGRISKTEYNELSVRLELQADFLAGVWTHHADRMNQILEEGDIEEALRAANAIGDDMIQKKSQGYVVPDAFTHGTSAQRVRWFKRGYETGNLKYGDTFGEENL